MEDPPLSNHPLNLALRFLLELALLAALAYWGFTRYHGVIRWVVGIGAPIAAAAVWAIFRVPGDGGQPIVVTPGPIRLVLEATLFSAGIAALFASHRPRLAIVLAILSVAHYIASYDRIRRLSLLAGLAAMIASASCVRTAASPPARWTEPTTGMEFVLIPAGRFEMGLLDPPTDIRPATRHRVSLSRPFYLARFEVTQAQWQQLMGSNPSQFPDCGPQCPVETVSWHDAQQFLQRLQAANPGQRFRLPTEAEWEYACRAGSRSRYGSGIDTLRPELANYDARIPFEGSGPGKFIGRPAQVGSYAANAWRLHDMNGNVWEWTQDEYCPYATQPVIDPAPRCGTDTVAIRGGSWAFSANAARCGRRYTHARGDSGYSLGFRIVREVAENRQTQVN